MSLPTPSAEVIAHLRRLCAEPSATTYSDDLLKTYLERYPLADAAGLTPDREGWAGRWDVSPAAADIWDEKAAAVAGSYDFSADGGSFSRSQIVEQYRTEAKRARARGSASSVPIWTYPARVVDLSEVGNLSEWDQETL
jgi:predicted homoserine dehydrogenase-like protein